MDRPIPVVIVGRNNLGLSKKTVASVLASDVPVDILFVDNDSKDGTAAWIRTKGVTTIFTQEQWSLAKCWNIALQALWKAGHKVALVLNNDVEIRADCVRILNEHGGEFVTCVSVDSHERLAIPGDRTAEELRLRERPHPDFSAWMIRKSVTDKIGYFNESMYPAYCEDSDYHVRMHRAGINAICIDMPFLHHGASTLKTADAGESTRIRRGAQKNRDLFKKLYGCLPGTPEYEALFV